MVAELKSGAPDRVFTSDIKIDRSIRCDPKRLAQLFSNLVANAVTYGDPQQPIGVVARSEPERFISSVANGGEPIPENLLADIFAPFSRGSHRPSRQGLGLGLYICHEIAQEHGGTLSVASSAEETCFTFTIPSTV